MSSTFEAKGVVGVAVVGMCKPDLGYYLIAEYSPTFKHGSSTNIQIPVNKDLVLP
jgi:hypothetical protein